jgi:hypothetical protein
MLHTVSWMVTRDQAIKPERVQSGVLTSFLVGGVAGGAVMGAIIAAPAWALYSVIGPQPAAFAAVSAVVAIAYAGRAMNLWPAPRPQFASQVPEAWRNIFSANVASFIYAAALGMIYFTRLASLVAYPLAVIMLGLGGTPLAIIEIMAVTGLARASTAVLVPLLRLDLRGSEAVLALMQRYSGTVRHIEVIVLGCLVLLPFMDLLTRL